MMISRLVVPCVVTAICSVSSVVGEDEPLFLKPINVTVPPIASDLSVRYDYDIVYVRARRAGDTVHKRFYSDFSTGQARISALPWCEAASRGQAEADEAPTFLSVRTAASLTGMSLPKNQ